MPRPGTRGIWVGLAACLFGGPIVAGFLGSLVGWQAAYGALADMPIGSDGVDPEIATALQAGNLIAAIRRHRELTGAGLAEARSAVLAIQDRRG